MVYESVPSLQLEENINVTLTAGRYRLSNSGSHLLICLYPVGTDAEADQLIKDLYLEQCEGIPLFAFEIGLYFSI
jgi:hypothetical protein